jgi:hypothetical protein
MQVFCLKAGAGKGTVPKEAAQSGSLFRYKAKFHFSN